MIDTFLKDKTMITKTKANLTLQFVLNNDKVDPFLSVMHDFEYICKYITKVH